MNRRGVRTAPRSSRPTGQLDDPQTRRQRRADRGVTRSPPARTCPTTPPQRRPRFKTSQYAPAFPGRVRLPGRRQSLRREKILEADALGVPISRHAGGDCPPASFPSVDHGRCRTKHEGHAGHFRRSLAGTIYPSRLVDLLPCNAAGHAVRERTSTHGPPTHPSLRDEVDEPAHGDTCLEGMAESFVTTHEVAVAAADPQADDHARQSRSQTICCTARSVIPVRAATSRRRTSGSQPSTPARAHGWSGRSSSPFFIRNTIGAFPFGTRHCRLTLTGRNSSGDAR